MRMSVAKPEEISSYCENGGGGGDASCTMSFNKIDVRALLKQFGICCETIEYLFDCGVNEDVLRKMRMSDVDALFPGLEYFGQKIIFRESWIEWRSRENIPVSPKLDNKPYSDSLDSSVDTNTNSLLNSLEPWSDTATDITFPNLLDIHTYELTDTTATNSIDTSHHLNIIPSASIQLGSNHSSPASQIEKPCLQNILKNSIRGRRVLNHYKKYQCLNPDLQKDLTHVIIDSFEIQDIWLNTKELEYYANQIHLLFPTERSDVYFRKRTARKNPTGKLYDRQVNARQKKKEKEQSGSASVSISTRVPIIANNNMMC